jgi:uncharacterized protein (TIGR00369 family)
MSTDGKGDAAPKRLSAEDVQAIFDRSPVISFMGLAVVSVDHAHEAIVVRMPMRPEFERRPGTRQFHGGPLAALIDTAGDFAIGIMVGGGVPTINLRIDYLRPAVGEAVIAKARVRRQGRTVAVVDIELEDDKGRLVALGRGSYSPKIG